MVAFLPKRRRRVSLREGFGATLAEHPSVEGCRHAGRRESLETGRSPDARDRPGKEAGVKAYWVTAGVGVLITVVGGVVYGMSDHKFGLILILGGMVVAIMGLVMRIVEAYMGNKVK
jgi:hypothetical protein